MSASTTNPLMIKPGDTYNTPRELYEALDLEFHFNYDAAPINPVRDELKTEWGTRTFLNPPYRKLIKWVEKSISEYSRDKLIVLVLPVDPSTEWFSKLYFVGAHFRLINHRLSYPPVATSSRNASMIVILSPGHSGPSFKLV